MCLPALPLAALAIGAATTAVSVVGQIQSSKAAAASINANSAIQAEQIADRASAEMFDRSVESFERIGQQRVTGASRGVNDASRSFSMMTQQIQFNREFDDTRTMTNTRNAQKARESQTKSQLAQQTRPSLLGAGLQIALSGASAYSKAGGKF